MALVNNHDVVSVCQRLVRYTEEMSKAVSAGLSELNPFDRNRIEAYLLNVRSLLDWSVAQPQLDLPESSPRQWSVDDKLSYPRVESEVINDILRLMDVLYEEIINSQSARKAAGVAPFDSVRWYAVFDKTGAYLVDFVDKATPLDLPESSPSVAGVAPGKKGI